MQTRRLLFLLLFVMLLLSAANPAAGQNTSRPYHAASAADDVEQIYQGMATIKEPEGFSACNFTGDLAPIPLGMRVTGNEVLMQIKGTNAGTRLGLSCPQFGWSGDLHYKVEVLAWLVGTYDGSGTVDEILVEGTFTRALFTYEWRNCSGSCPEDKTVSYQGRNMKAFGKFADEELTIVFAGAVRDEFNTNWGFWGAELTGTSPIATMETLRSRAFVNNMEVDEGEERMLSAQDIIKLVQQGLFFPSVVVQCQVGEEAGTLAILDYVPRGSILDILDFEAQWVNTPQLIADWSLVCGFAVPGRAANVSLFSQHLIDGALIVKQVATELSPAFETDNVVIDPGQTPSFLIAHRQETGTSLIAAFGGPVYLIPADENLEPFVLEQGQMVTVTTNAIGPTMDLHQLYLPGIVSQ